MTEVWEDPRVAEGIELQMAALRRLESTGVRRIGWKAAYGTSAGREALGLTAPIVGYLIDSTRLPPGAAVSIAGWDDPRVEPELAVRIGPGLRIDGFATAIELVDMVHPISELAILIGDNVSHRHVIVGEFTPAEPPFSLRFTHDGEPLAEIEDALAEPGRPEDVKDHVERWVAAHGQSLHEGDLIITGSIIPPVPAVAGEFRVALTGLDAVAVNLRN